MSIRVLVVDDHPVYRQGLTTALGASPVLEVLGEAGDGAAAVAAVAALAPAVVLMALPKPGPASRCSS